MATQELDGECFFWPSRNVDKHNGETDVVQQGKAHG